LNTIVGSECDEVSFTADYIIEDATGEFHGAGAKRSMLAGNIFKC